MAYREVSMFGETWITRLDNDALYEWHNERAELALRNYPDRPADIDDVKHRIWIMHPDEEFHPHFASAYTNRAGRGVESIEQLFIMTTDFLGLPVEYGIYAVNGEFRGRIYFPKSGNRQQLTFPNQEIGKVNETFEAMLVTAAECILVPDAINILTYEDVQGEQLNHDAVVKEITEYYRSIGWELEDDWVYSAQNRMKERAEAEIAQR